jgi:TolA-binding protein
VVLAVLGLLTPTGARAQDLFEGLVPDAPAPVVTTPDGWTRDAVDQLDRSVRHMSWKLNGIGRRGNPPPLLAPDSEVGVLQNSTAALTDKLAAQSDEAMRLTGDIQVAQHDAQTRQQQIAELTARIDALTQREDAEETHLGQIDAQLAPPPPSAPPPATTGSADSDLQSAVALLAAGKRDEAEPAFEAVTTRWPQTPQAHEAWYQLGRLSVVRTDNSGAIADFAKALQGWPKTAWAPDALASLAAALAEAHRPTETCEAISQFNQAYKSAASANLRQKMQGLGKVQGCH